MYSGRYRAIGSMTDKIKKEMAKLERQKKIIEQEKELNRVKEMSIEIDYKFCNTIKTPLRDLSFIEHRYKLTAKKKKSKLRALRKKKPYIRGKAISIESDNQLINGKWRKKRLVKNIEKIKKIITNNYNLKENILLLKAYSNLVSPKTIVGYKKKRKSTVSQLDESVKCAVCKTNYAYCNHHIQLLINGGGNEDYNLIPICKSCHKKIHDWLK